MPVETSKQMTNLAQENASQSVVTNEYDAIHVPQAVVLNVSKNGHGVKILDNLQGSKESASRHGPIGATVSSEVTKRDAIDPIFDQGTAVRGNDSIVHESVEINR